MMNKHWHRVSSAWAARPALAAGRGSQQLRCEMCGVGTDASTLITSQRANFPVMEGTPTQLGPDGCQGTGKKKHTHTRTQTHRHTQSHVSCVRTCAEIYSNIFWSCQTSSELIWEMGFLPLVMKKKKGGKLERNENNNQDLFWVECEGRRRRPLTVGQSESQKKLLKSKLNDKMWVRFHY